jgi:WXG100 family type VII secretion target
MAEIRVTATSLREKSGNIKSISANMQQIEGDIRSEIDRIKPAWEGDAANAAYEKYMKISEELKGIYTTVQTYSAFLDKSAESFAQAESKSMGSVQSGS